MENINIEPYKLNARYYHFFVESDGIDRVLVQKDIPEVTLEGNYLVFPEGFHVMNIIVDFNATISDAVANRLIDLQFDTDGRQKVYLPNAKNFDYGDLYILGHYI